MEPYIDAHGLDLNGVTLTPEDNKVINNYIETNGVTPESIGFSIVKKDAETAEAIAEGEAEEEVEVPTDAEIRQELYTETKFAIHREFFQSILYSNGYIDMMSVFFVRGYECVKPDDIKQVVKEINGSDVKVISFVESSKAMKMLRECLSEGCSAVVIASNTGNYDSIEHNSLRSVSVTDFLPFAIEFATRIEATGLHKFTQDGISFLDIIKKSPPIPPHQYIAMMQCLHKTYSLDERDQPVSPAVLSLFNRLSTAKWVSVPGVSADAPQKIDELPGVDEETKRALQRLLRKMQEGKPLSQGALLFGPPGTGKTMIAKLLAKESRRNFIHASCTEWQSAGAMDEHLKAIRESFSEAIKAAPSVMFLDEVDSVGNRSGIDRGGYYISGVVNAMLECVQAAVAANVVIIGATNRIDSIDAALTRPGRLGNHISIPLPSKEGVIELSRYYFSKWQLDWREIALRAGHCSPARLQVFSTEIMEIAEDDGRKTPDMNDVDEGFRREARRLLNGRDPNKVLPPLAFGLCAKARMAYLIWGDHAGINEISLRPGLIDLGRLDMPDINSFSCGTAAELLQRLHFELSAAAGRRAIALATASAGNILESVGCLAHLDSTERLRVLILLRQINETGIRSRDHGGTLASGYQDNMTDDEAKLLKSAWNTALKSAMQGVSGIYHAAQTLLLNGVIDGEDLRSCLFDEVASKKKSKNRLH